MKLKSIFSSFKILSFVLVILIGNRVLGQVMPASGTATNSGSGSWTVPANVYSITIDAWGGGGAGGAAGCVSSNGAGGGAGGSKVSSTISVTPGQTIYYSVAAARASGLDANTTRRNGNDTWVNKAANSAPTAASNGA
ncbi:MAG: hypothetical protein ACK50Y_11900, partial [Flavobacteriia bacterium]